MTDTNTQPRRFRKKPIEIEAMQWANDDASAEALWQWTNEVVSRNVDGSPHMTACRFMMLQDWANSDAEDTLGCDEVQRRVSEGYTAVVYDSLHGTWVNLRTGDWVIKGVQGEFYPCNPDIFGETYEAVQS